MTSVARALPDLAASRLTPVGGGTPAPVDRESSAPIGPVSDPARLRAMLETHYDLVWRSLRRFGVRSGDVDDAAQQVFLVAARKLDLIEVGAERSSRVGTAMRVASDARRAATRRREVADEDPIRERRDSSPGPEELADRHRARALLDEALDAMPLDLRAVFVLFELEELPTAEIAALLGVPVGTAASRLRRAREEFHRIAARLRARAAHVGGAS